MSLSAVDNSQPNLPPGIPSVAVKGEQAPFQSQSDTPSFWDLLDVVNPLQHIPVVSTIYRAITGDKIGAVPRIVGGTLYGGPFGLIGAVANEVVRTDTGQDLGEHAMAFLLPDGLFGPTQPTAVAANTDGQKAQSAPPMLMQPFESPEATTPQPQEGAEPPPATVEPAQTVERQPLAAPVAQAQSQIPSAALPNNIFRPLDKPLDPASAVSASPAAAPTPAPDQAQASTPTPAAKPAADKIVSSAASGKMAEAGLMQPMQVKGQEAPTPEPKKFEAKTTSLNHGKMYANASPYMTKVEPAQKVAQAEGIPVTHPMLQGAQGSDKDWMAGKMAEALDKYSRTQKLLPADSAAQQAESPPS